MADHWQMMLGKLPARRSPTVLSARKYMLTPGGVLPAVKPSVDYISAVPSWPMYDNDTKPNCAIAAIGHMVQAWSTAIGQPVTPTLDEILRVFAILSPDNNGCVLSDVLDYWALNPICGIQIAGHALVDSQNEDEIKVAMDIYGGLYCGAELPAIAQVQDVWDVSSSPNAAYGSWGGHCIPFLQYLMEAEARCITWGAPKPATWAWIKQYMSEIYALISPAWLEPGGKSPEGLDVDQLKFDLNLV